MIRRLKSVRYIAREIADAADSALAAYREDRVLEEPQITDRILGAIEDRVGRLSVRSYDTDLLLYAPVPRHDVKDKAEDRMASHPSSPISWKARTLRTGHGIAAEEKRHGADLMGVLNLDLFDYRVTKGFLAQAKRAEPDQPFSNREWDRLRSQCDTMLARTPASFVWVYSSEMGIRIFSANAVVALKSRTIFDLYSRSLANFFENHIESFFGDHRLNSTDIQTLDVLAESPPERILELSATQSD